MKTKNPEVVGLQDFNFLMVGAEGVEPPTLSRPSACKADALNQLSYAPVFRFLSAIAALDFASSLLTTVRLLRRSSLVRLALTGNKLQNYSFLLGDNCVKLPLLASSLPQGNCGARQSFSLFSPQNELRLIFRFLSAIAALDFAFTGNKLQTYLFLKNSFPEWDCKDMQDFRLCKFFLIFYKFLMCPAFRMTLCPVGMNSKLNPNLF